MRMQKNSMEADFNYMYWNVEILLPVSSLCRDYQRDKFISTILCADRYIINVANITSLGVWAESYGCVSRIAMDNIVRRHICNAVGRKYRVAGTWLIYKISKYDTRTAFYYHLKRGSRIFVQ